MKPILFIFGPSGVGKSYVFELIKEKDFLSIHIDTDDKNKTFAAHGFSSEWDEDFSKVNFDIFVSELRKRLNTIKAGIIISFPTTYRFKQKNLSFLRQAGVIPMLLWGEEKDCKKAVEGRRKEKGIALDWTRYDQKNLLTFELYSRPEYDLFRLELFQTDGNRFSDEELKNKISSFIQKFIS